MAAKLTEAESARFVYVAQSTGHVHTYDVTSVRRPEAKSSATLLRINTIRKTNSTR